MESVITLSSSGDRKRRRGELWLDRQDLVDSNPGVSAGAVVDLENDQGHFRGRGFYSSKGPIAVRVVSNAKKDVNRTFFESRIQRSIDIRKRFYRSRLSYRLVNGAGDFLPGLIVDKYGGVLVVQCRNQTIDRHCDTILDLLDEILRPASIYARNDVRSRESEGLKQYRGLMRGEAVPDHLTIQEEPYRLVTNIKTGQKTGYYLDQEDNRRQLWSWSEGREVIDCFCYTGGWGMAALHGGASHVTFVDQNKEALEIVEKNAALNGWDDQINTERADAIDFLNQVRQSDRSPGMIVLDPPAFAKSKQHVSSARRGYKEINLRSMQILKPRGLLATSSCSAPLSMQMFNEIVTDSAHDAHVLCRILQKRYQSADHPWLANLNSSLYLKCILGEVTLL